MSKLLTEFSSHNPCNISCFNLCTRPSEPLTALIMHWILECSYKLASLSPEFLFCLQNNLSTIIPLPVLCGSQTWSHSAYLVLPISSVLTQATRQPLSFRSCKKGHSPPRESFILTIFLFKCSQNGKDKCIMSIGYVERWKGGRWHNKAKCRKQHRIAIWLCFFAHLLSISRRTT